ncbi:MAG TPA: manganese efflux pump MntP family protein [Kofleriaceae bacterium]|nr:manganese efflux pump MntP family protein [Kofleriaceae bacterium]
MISAIALAFGLAMDATAVSAARGVSRRRGEAVVLPSLFGGFQAAMAALGWLIGAAGVGFVEQWDHWIAFVLLAGIGVKMVIEALRGGGDGDEDMRTGALVYFALAVATSIDAAAAGLTLPLLAVPPWLALVLIGGVTFACCAGGYALGHRLGARIGKPLELAGGVVLVAIGTRILIQHL